MTDPRSFLRKVWSLQGKSDGAYGFVAHKDWDTGDWQDLRTTSADQLPEMDLDWYFGPCLFKGKRRLRELALPSRVLYADLDEVDPRDIEDVPPTLAWETSPDRYQGLWVVDRHLQLDSFENLNRRLTYHVGADRGGWSSTKVLRVPGTTSTKYGKSRAKRFRVRTVFKGPRYKVQDLHRLLPAESGLANGGGHSTSNNGGGSWGDIPEGEIVLRKWRRKLPTRAKQLLRTDEPAEGDDRSARLYELEGLLLDAGLSREETLAVARESAWNKYRGQRREFRQLRYEINKHLEEKQVREVERMVGRVRASRNGTHRNGHDKKLARLLAERAQQEGLPSLSYQEFLDTHFPEPEWLVEGFWGLGAYGVWAGEFKSFKTVTLLDFAVSVASGQPFLGRFEVCHTGPVVYAFDEGTPGYIQDRLRRIAWQKGVAGGSPNGNQFEFEFPKDLPMHLSPGPKLNLTDEKSQARLDKHCAVKKPVLVILESFYLMAQEIDENSAREVTPALSFLKDLAQRYNTAVVISHHYNKEGSTPDGRKRRPGLRMSGSNVFGRWYESAVYLEREGDEQEGRALITAEHREQKGTGKQHLQVSMDTEDDVHYDVEIVDKNMLIDNGDAPSSRLAAIDVPCPECGVEADVRCRDQHGKERVFHRERKEAAKNGEKTVESQVDKILKGNAG